ncbi:MAG TPA: hypothetical protein VHV31_04850 [Nitrolancea sp.]|jgi:hypothetical protein|nr:hypothetical protein [Nitrolancea sp.]
MYFLDSTTLVRLVLDRQQDMTERAITRAQFASHDSRMHRSAKTRGSLQHTAGAALIRFGQHLQS